MKWFDYAAPATAADALDTLAKNPGALMLAGGTDLLVQLRTGRRETALVVDIKKIPELNALTANSGGLTLGAAVPCYVIERNSDVRRHWHALAEVAGLIGGTQIQGRASIGGNLCNAAPSADAVPLLIAMGAICEIASAAGRRTIPVEQFCTAPGRNVLAPGEILVALHIPKPPPGSGACYLRFIPRNEMDIAVAGAGVAVTIANGRISAARVALSSVAPTPLFVDAAGAAIVGQAPEAAAVAKAAQAARDAARPISDMRGTEEYRRHLCAVLTRRALETAIARAKESN
ncbi:MAG: xanthine dehydrogenase family protein subunit M [Bryobacteraceae bacterium]